MASRECMREEQKVTGIVMKPTNTKQMTADTYIRRYKISDP